MENMENNQESQAPEPTSNKGGFGPVLGIIVIIIVIALGGLYYFTVGINQIPSYEADSALEEKGSSDAVVDIEADLDATDLSEIDTLLEDINADLEQI